ncbi:MAG: hypothetical protein U5L09_03800 [Bacteroidales bacterium]|nr:hypothetical protein [Bacteroidales bacterium]
MKTKKARKIITIPALLLILILWQGCSDYQQCKRIETGPVDITIYPNSTEFQELNVVNGYVHLTSRPPSKGIIVYRYSQDQFKAYERSCPHAPDNPDAVVTGRGRQRDGCYRQRMRHPLFADRRIAF